MSNVSKNLLGYLERIQLYKSYVDKIAQTSAKDSSTRYIVQNNLLKEIQAFAAKNNLSNDVYTKEQAYVAQQADITTKALAKFGIKIE